MPHEQRSLPFGTSDPAAERKSTHPALGRTLAEGAGSLERARRRAPPLQRRLSELVGCAVHLRFTDNRRTMVSWRPHRSGWVLRLHHMFVDADDATVHALARFVSQRDQGASALLDRFIERNRERIRRAPAPPRRLRTEGAHHDLQAIFDRLNAQWFEGSVQARITWGRRATARRRRRSIRLGTYREDQRLIRIHPALDQAWVPGFFVAYVVFHEMLHGVLPSRSQGARRRRHCAEFRARERAYPDYERARRWERHNIHRLLER